MKTVAKIEVYHTIEIEFDNPEKAKKACAANSIEQVASNIVSVYKNQPRQTLGDAVDGFLDLGLYGRFQMVNGSEYISTKSVTSEMGLVRIIDCGKGRRATVEVRETTTG